MIKMAINKVIIFDCDGTLLDTFLLIEKTVYKTFEKMLPNYPLTKEEAHSFFGPALDESFKRFVKTEEEVKKLVKCYRDYNEALMADYVVAYDGILELLDKLKENGYKLAIVSNKVTPAVIKGLEICDIDKYFDLIIGLEKLDKAKPDPDGIYQVLDYFNVKDAIMIGDTIIDINTGQNANIDTIGVTWCKTTKEVFLASGATYVVDEPLEILKIVGD